MSQVNLLRVSVGGRGLEVDSVLMHSAAGVRRWQNLVAQAEPLLGGFSSGIGFWGSPVVAAAGAAAIGILEAAVTNSNQKQGLQLLGEAADLYERLSNRGLMVPVHTIDHLESPDFTKWASEGVVESELDVRNASSSQKSSYIKEYGATQDELASGFIVRETVQNLVVLPSEFVVCKSGDRKISIRWDKIGVYEAVDDLS